MLGDGSAWPFWRCQRVTAAGRDRSGR